jgi:hypothetical protein
MVEKSVVSQIDGKIGSIEWLKDNYQKPKGIKEVLHTKEQKKSFN